MKKIIFTHTLNYSTLKLLRNRFSFLCEIFISEASGPGLNVLARFCVDNNIAIEVVS